MSKISNPMSCTNHKLQTILGILPRFRSNLDQYFPFKNAIQIYCLQNMYKSILSLYELAIDIISNILTPYLNPSTHASIFIQNQQFLRHSIAFFLYFKNSIFVELFESSFQCLFTPFPTIYTYKTHPNTYIQQ